jgi:hypothetical protein
MLLDAHRSLNLHDGSGDSLVHSELFYSRTEFTAGKPALFFGIFFVVAVELTGYVVIK